MFKKILIAFIAFIVVFFGVASTQPDDFTLSRSTVVAASPADVFAHVNDFHLWEAWSPWAKMDPSMKTTYEGPSSGDGSSYSWVGNSKVGEGKMTIIKSQPTDLILINLEFLKPMKATNLTEFSFKPEGQGTLVTWTMSGKNNLFAKAIHLVVSMDKMVGPDFEKGLAQLKAATEASKK